MGYFKFSWYATMLTFISLANSACMAHGIRVIENKFGGFHLYNIIVVSLYLVLAILQLSVQLCLRRLKDDHLFESGQTLETTDMEKEGDDMNIVKLGQDIDFPEQIDVLNASEKPSDKKYDHLEIMKSR